MKYLLYKIITSVSLDDNSKTQVALNNKNNLIFVTSINKISYHCHGVASRIIQINI